MRQDDQVGSQEHRHFFISYTSSDRQWAEWIAMQLEEAGYTLFIQAWDFRPGSNVVAEMERAAKYAERTLLVLSPAYLLSDFTFAEWAAAFSQDPRGTHGRVLPVQIEPCDVSSLLGEVVSIDLVSLDEMQARERLLEGVKKGRGKPMSVGFPIQHVPHAHASFPGSLPTIWNIPYLRNPHFTGRDELLDQLTQQLASEAPEQGTTTHRAALTQPRAVQGLGGIGKTQIAVEYAYRSRDLGWYRHTIWVNAASKEALLISFTELAELLPNFSALAETNQQKLVQAIKRWLEECQEYWLLIFDNADEISLIHNYLPQQGNGSILLTTRAYAVGSLATPIEVETMGFVEGTQLLLRRAQRFGHATDEEVNQAGNIVLALDHFPLALDQAGAFLDETGCSLEEYLDLYRIQRQELLARRGEQATRYPDSVATTWSISLQKVEQTNPAAGELLRLFAFLAPNRIPEELIKRGATYWPSLLRRATLNPFMLNQMIETLLKFSLVKRLTEDHALSIHCLVQAVQMDLMAPKVQRQWIQRVIRAVNQVFPKGAQFIDTWPQCLRYLDQAQTCYTLMEHSSLLLTLPDGTRGISKEVSKVVSWKDKSMLFWSNMRQLLYPSFLSKIPIHRYSTSFPFSDAVDLLNKTGLYLYTHALYEQVELLYQRALAIRECQPRADPFNTATILNNLASLYDKQGKYAQAEPLFIRTLAIWEQQAGTKHPGIIGILNNLAGLYAAQGKYAEAELLYKRALDIAERSRAKNALLVYNITISLNNLAHLYLLWDKYKEAEPLLIRVLTIDPHRAASLANLADAYSGQKRYSEAEPLLIRALAIWEQQMGAEHPAMALGLNSLAAVYAFSGKYVEAESLYLRSLAIHERLLGTAHPDTALILNNLGALYRSQGKYAQAKPLYVRALTIYEKQLGAEHPVTQAVREDYLAFFGDHKAVL